LTIQGASGNLTGNLTGTATTAQGLTGTPNITVGTIGATSLNASGVVTATSFSGSLTGNVTGNATGLSGTPNITVGTIGATSLNASGVVTATTFSGDLTGNVTGNATGLSGTPNITVGTIGATSLNASGVVTATTFSGNVTGNLSGNVSASGLSTFSGGINVGTGASISSPATNVLTLGTNNSERVRITSAGAIGVGTVSPQQSSIPSIHLHTNTSDDARIAITTPTKPNSRIGYFGLSNKFGIDVHNGFEIRDASASYATRLSIDSSGRVTMPAQPAFDAVYTTPNGANGTTTTNTEIKFNVANTNVGSYFSTSTGRFTAPVAGTYFFSMFGMSSVNDTVWYEMRKNGNLITYTHNPYVSFNAGGAYKAVGYSFVITLAVNDYVSVFTGGTTSGMYGGGNNHNGFCGYLIG